MTSKKPIIFHGEYGAALKRIDELMGATEDSSEDAELASSTTIS